LIRERPARNAPPGASAEDIAIEEHDRDRRAGEHLGDAAVDELAGFGDSFRQVEDAARKACW
jgi:hypothetical protein